LADCDAVLADVAPVGGAVDVLDPAPPNREVDVPGAAVLAPENPLNELLFSTWGMAGVVGADTGSWTDNGFSPPIGNLGEGPKRSLVDIDVFDWAVELSVNEEASPLPNRLPDAGPLSEWPVKGMLNGNTISVLDASLFGVGLS